ncbi:MAG: hypothetical protein K0S07_1154 [Chlamydiales bacterium]|nr:hypothetical protein [Chlamydiales bacterium]
MIHDQSYGIIPFQRTASGWRVLLIKHKGGHWSFPKGHAESGETHQETAFRELQEETGMTVARLLSDVSFEETYSFSTRKGMVLKKVVYFLAEVCGDCRPDLKEVTECLFLDQAAAKKQLSFKEAKLLLDEAYKALPQ